ncbi:hypothetical protein B296_00034463, partial [Ensete ventricosum]
LPTPKIGSTGDGAAQFFGSSIKESKCQSSCKPAMSLPLETLLDVCMPVYDSQIQALVRWIRQARCISMNTTTALARAVLDDIAEYCCAESTYECTWMGKTPDRGW